MVTVLIKSAASVSTLHAVLVWNVSMMMTATIVFRTINRRGGHPCTTTHKNVPVERRPEVGLTDGLVRLSMGLEDPQDIIDDILTALGAI